MGIVLSRRSRSSIQTAIIGIGAGWTAWRILRRSSWMDLRGKVVVITGGSRGLGLQMAREFGARGARVAICARNQAELERAKEDLDGRRIGVYTVQCDISSREESERMIAEVTREFGEIDVLVNNAGIIEVGPVSEMTIEDFERAMGVIFWGALYPALALLPSMRRRREGRIVNITSIGGKISVPHLIPYSCAKFALVALSEGLRAEMAPLGVRITTIVPGLMRTGSHLHAQFKGKTEREYTWFSLGAATPLTSISAERAARSIVRATIRGDREKILSVPADLAARVHGALPELTSGIMTLVSRLLPSAVESGSATETGREAQAKLNSRLLETINFFGQRAAEALNQLR